MMIKDIVAELNVNYLFQFLMVSLYCNRSQQLNYKFIVNI